jgi:archaellum component FlaC
MELSDHEERLQNDMFGIERERLSKENKALKAECERVAVEFHKAKEKADEASRQFGIKQCVDFLKIFASNNWSGHTDSQKERDADNEFIWELADRMLGLAPEYQAIWTTLQEKNTEIQAIKEKAEGLVKALESICNELAMLAMTTAGKDMELSKYLAMSAEKARKDLAAFKGDK